MNCINHYKDMPGKIDLTGKKTFLCPDEPMTLYGNFVPLKNLPIRKTEEPKMKQGRFIL